MAWSLYKKEQFLEPLKFSNGKTQQDVVEEVLNEIKKGEKIIFIKGICGSGKSAISLNIAKELGKTSIIVPGKNLQQQYKKDYEKNIYLLKNNKKLKISVITGRNNHSCKFLQDKNNLFSRFKEEKNLKLYDIFEGKREKNQKNLSAENPNIPCKIEIKEKNLNKIKEYLKQNKKINLRNFSTISGVKRLSIAPVCPYWGPVFPEEYEIKLDNSEKKKYTAINGEYYFYQRRPGCGFYEQFKSYIESDVIVFNSLKYKFEFSIGRKPKTEVEIIDECDEFLDSFANQKNINIERLQNALIYADINQELGEIVNESLQILKQFKKNSKIKKTIETKEILPLKKTGIYDLIKLFNKNNELFYELDDESYIFDFLEVVKTFKDFLNETYLTIHKKDNDLIVNLVTTNLEKKFKEIVEKNKVIILMSGTLHSEKVLNEIFGLQNFKIIEAEIEQQGQIKIKKTGLEKDCRYSNFNSGKYSKEEYLRTLDKCIEIAKKPCLIHVNAFNDLPLEQEIEKLKLKNLISKEELRQEQINDKTGEEVEKFKSKKKEVLFSTRVSRGIDFPGEQCNSIVFTKYPNPNVKDAFWRILQLTKPSYYWGFYKDKANRELWQRVYRGLRSKEDKVEVLSPDSRVLEVFEKMDKRQ